MRLDRMALAIVLATAPVLPAFAQDAPAPPGGDWPDYDWNPQPMDDDVILPMPCGGAMAFRRVETPAQPNWLADTGLQMGNNDITGQEHSESLLPENVVGGLTASGPEARFYLIAKYELSRRQYDAVMAASCPKDSDEASLPIEGISWLDAQTVAARYTEWLYGHAADVMAERAGPGAFLRLPSEEEWEFAARGGLAVTDAVRRKKTFPLDGPVEDYIWFAGFKSCDGMVQPIGILKPNPLGLFDILGNVQEFTGDMYRLRTRDRQHGQVGGVVARGGSCLTDEMRIRSSDRDEVVITDAQTGAARGKSFTGIRLVVGAPILTSPERINAIHDDWARAGQMRIALDPGQDPIEALGVIAEAEENPQIRDALENARDLFDREMARRNAIESRSAGSVAQAGLLAVRDYIRGLEDIDRVRLVVAEAPDDPVVRDWGQRTAERLKITENMLLASIVHAAEDFDGDTFDAAIRIIAKENEARLADMAPRTRETTETMLEMFAGFVRNYRGASDTDPQVYLDQIADYYAELIGN